MTRPHPLALPRLGGALALLACTVTACVRNPATGAQQLVLISEAQEIAMGRAADSEVVASIGLYPDQALQDHVQRLGVQLASVSERPNLPWTFRVVDDAAVNAFAIPGGFVYITRGILASLSSEAELAAVIGHEIGHITARHSAVSMSRQQLISMGLAVGAMTNRTIAQYAGTVSQGLQVLYLKFSRDDETEADDLGLRYMQRGRFDPREMPGVFTMLERVSRAAGGGRVPEWMETHPDPGRRHDRITAEVAALPQEDLAGMTVDRDGYLLRLRGLVFGEDPRQGYFVGTRFLHPVLRFQLAFPQGWTVQNTAQAVAAVSPGQDAIVVLTPSGAATADEATRAFLAQTGVTAGTPARSTASGLTSVITPFTATTQEGMLRGTVAFVQLDGAVYRTVAYATDARWGTYQATAEQSLRSFQRLTDPAALNVQPHRLDIVRLDRRTTITELAGRRTSPADPAVLARINGVEPDTTLAAGRLVKWVTGQPLPGR